METVKIQGIKMAMVDRVDSGYTLACVSNTLNIVKQSGADDTQVRDDTKTIYSASTVYRLLMKHTR